MPTYEYECTKCGAVVEIFQSITEPARKKLKKDDPKPCDCGAAVKRRIGTGAGIIFKGTGFYTTDYRSENYKKAAKAEKDSGTAKKKSGSADTAKPGDSGSSQSAPKSDGAPPSDSGSKKAESRTATV